MLRTINVQKNLIVKKNNFLKLFRGNIKNKIKIKIIETKISKDSNQNSPN